MKVQFLHASQQILKVISDLSFGLMRSFVPPILHIFKSLANVANHDVTVVSGKITTIRHTLQRVGFRVRVLPPKGDFTLAGMAI